MGNKYHIQNSGAKLLEKMCSLGG